MPERKLRVFICHSKEDKTIVRDLHDQLTAESWVDIWLDEMKLLPGQEWGIEIENAVENTDVVIVCLSTKSVDKEGYIQKELRFVLNIADEKPKGTIFVIPLRLDDCIVPRRIRDWQYVDNFPKENQRFAYQRLLESLKLRAKKLGINFEHKETDYKSKGKEAGLKNNEDKGRNDKEIQREAHKSHKNKSPFVAIFLSFLLGGGGGQIYLGQWKKGLAIIIVSTFTFWIIVGLIIYIIGMVDSYTIALRMNDGNDIGEWDFGFSWSGLIVSFILIMLLVIVSIAVGLFAVSWDMILKQFSF